MIKRQRHGRVDSIRRFDAQTRKSKLASAIKPCLEGLEGRRLLSTGTLNYGPLDADVKGFQFDYRNGTAVQSDGKLLVAGYVGTTGVGTGRNVAVARYNTNGTIDASYGSGGVAVLSLTSDQEGKGLAIDTSGRAVVAVTANNSGVRGFAAARFTNAGVADTSFDGDGYAQVNFNGGNENAWAIGARPDGRIVVGGTAQISASPSSRYDFALAQFTTSGALDTSFNTTGMRTHNAIPTNSDQITDLSIQPDGKIVVAGTSNGSATADGTNFVVYRYNANGTNDSSFNSGNVIIQSFGAGTVSAATGIALQADGKIVALGGVTANPAGTEDLGVARYTSSGVLDTSFNGTGKATVNFTTTDRPGAIAVETLGGTQKIVISGSTGSNGSIAVARFNLNGSLDTSFNVTGKETIPVTFSGHVGVERVPGLAVQSLTGPYKSNILAAGVDTSDNLILVNIDANSATANATPDTVWVDDNWTITNDTGPAGYSTGDTLYNAGHNVTAVAGVDGFDTIQGGINAVTAGGTVRVFDGTYSRPGPGANVALINKSLNLVGENAGIAGTGVRNPESIIDGQSAGENYYTVEIQASDVTVTGFEIKDPSYTGTADLSGILVDADNDHTNIHITDNIIHDLGSTSRPVAAGTYGINADRTDGLEIDHNLMYNIGNADASSNAFGVLVYGESPSDTSSNINVHDNTFHDIIQTTFGYAIDFGGDSTSAVATNNTITNSSGGIRTSGAMDGLASITGNLIGPGIRNIGIGVYHAGDTVTGNTFTGPMTHPTYDGKYFDGDASYAASIPAIYAANTFTQGVVFAQTGAVYHPSIWANVQGGVNGAVNGDLVTATAGTFNEDTNINKSVIVTGAGVGSTTILGAKNGAGATVQITASNVELKNFKITRDGNNVADWNDANGALNTVGVAIQGQAISGANIHDNLITQNRSGIDINNSNGHNIHNNRIVDNRTGMIFRNQTDNMTVTENEIANNWTVGVLFLDGSGGTNSPVQSAANSSFFNNNISGNWYGQIVDRQFGGSLATPGTNVKNFSSNWYGTNNPVVTTANSAEPGYAGQIPVAFGGSAVPPGGQPDVAGGASANFDITPYLDAGTDTSATYGFQGDFSHLDVTAQGAQSGATGRIGEAVGLLADGALTGANRIIDVRAGAYVENVSIAKPLKLRGAQFGVDARGRAASESTVTPANAANPTISIGFTGTLTIDGLSFSGGSSPAGGGGGGVIVTTVGPNNGMQILNNRFAGYSTSALFLNRGGTDITIDKNVMDGSNIVAPNGQAIFLNGPQIFNGIAVTNNNVVNNTGRYGLFVDGVHNVGESATRTPKIDGNLFDNNLQGLNLASRSFGTNGAPVLGPYGGEITDNVFSNNAFDGIQGGPQHVLITRNTFTNNARWGLNLGLAGQGVLPDRGAQNSVATENVFIGNGVSGSPTTTGDLIFASNQTAGTIATNHVNFNSFSGAGSGTAITYNGTETIDSSGNWFNNATGPTLATHPLGTGKAITGTGSGNIDFTPWLNSGADTSGTNGFQGDFSNLHVDDDSPQFGATGRINEGVADLTAVGTLNVHTGTYTENASTAGKSVTFSPGASPGQVTINGNLTFDGDDTFMVELAGTGAANYDSVHVSGTVDLGNANLAVSRSFTPFPGDTFTIVEKISAGATVGTFAGKPEGSTFNVSGLPLTITYLGGDGNDTVLSLSQPNTVWVNDTWVEASNTSGGTPGVVEPGDIVDSNPGAGDTSVTGKTFGYDAFSTIQNGANAVAASGTVNVIEGSYVESNIAISKGMTIHGFSRGNVVVSPGGVDGHVNDNFTSAQNGFVIGASNVAIDHLTIDGGASKNYRNALITNYNVADYGNIDIDNVTVSNIFRKGIGFYVTDNNKVTGDSISNSSFDHIGGTGVTFEATFAIAAFQSDTDISNVQITTSAGGIGTNYFTTDAYSPLVHITGTTISNMTGLAGIPVIGMDLSGLANGSSVIGGSVDVTGNATADRGIVVQYPATNADVTVSGVSITTGGGSGSDVGIMVYQAQQSVHPAQILNNIIDGTGSSSAGIDVTDDGSFFAESPHVGVTYATVKGNTITGIGGFDTAAISVDAAGGTASATIGQAGPGNGNTITNSDNGIDINGGSATITNNNLNVNGAGVRVRNGGNATVSSNIITAGDTGVDVSSTTAGISGNTITSGDIGIVVEGGTGSATINGGNQIDAGSVGIEVQTSASATIDGNTITTTTSGAEGVQVVNGASANILNNTISAFAVGVDVFTAGTTADIGPGNNITAVTTGISVSDSASANIHDNLGSIHDVPTGILVSGGAATINTNHIYNTTVDIDFAAGSSGSATNNTLGSATAAQLRTAVNGLTITGNTFENSMPVAGKRFDAFPVGGSTYVIPTVYSNNTWDTAVEVHNNPGLVYQPAIWANIQGGINASSNTDSVIAKTGNYVENVVIDKEIELLGDGQANTKVYPSFVGANTGGGSLAPGSSNVLLVQANNVTIHDLTVDGDNTALAGGVNFNGANIDARNGIITNHNAGVYNNLSVHDVSVKNIYLRGIYASSGGSFNFTNNTVDNVQANPASIAIFNFGGSGIIQGNTVSRAADAISANQSRGTQFLNNIVTNSDSGIHTDNNGGSGGVADVITGNNVSLGTPGSYGIWVFVPYFNVNVSGNTVSGVDVGLAAFGGQGGSTAFNNNNVNLTGRVGGVGAYVTTDTLGFGQMNVSASFTGNTISNAQDTGIASVQNVGGTVTLSIDNNQLTNDGKAIDVNGATSPLNITNNTMTGDGTSAGVTASNVSVLNYTNNTLTGFANGGALSSIGTINYTPTTNSNNDTFVLDATTMQDNGNQAIGYTGVTTLNVYTLGGDDQVTVQGAGAGLTTWVDTGNGTDTVTWQGSNGDDNVTFITSPTVGPAFTSTESVYYTAGSQRVNMLNAENRKILTLSGNDNVVYARLGGSVATGFDIETGDNNDTVLGGLGNDTILGGNGNDRLDGANGDDSIDGGNDNDTLYGGIGNDVLITGTGENQAYGQNGNDTIFAANGGLDFIDGGAGFDIAHSDAIDLLNSIEQVLP